MDEIKVGMRNNSEDRRRIRDIRKAARAIDGLSREIEPDDEDREPEGSVIIVDPDKSLVSFGTQVKALGAGKVGGYLVRFSTPEDPDLTGDFFTKSTEYGSNFSPPLLYHHGMDGTLKMRIIGNGAWKIDDIGLWYEAQLSMRDEYEKYIYELVEKGVLGYSSGALSHLIEREAVGKAYWIKTWIIGEASLTPTPAEPRNGVIPLKALMQNGEAPQAIAEAEQAQGREQNQDAKSTILETADADSEVIAMADITISKDELAEMLKSAAQEALKSLPAVEKPQAQVQVVKDEADQDFSSPGEFFKAVKNAALYPSHEDPRLRPLKATGMSEGVPADGGYLVQPQVASGILDRMYKTGEILSRISVDPVAGNSMLYNGVDETTHVGSMYGGLVGYWMAEGGTKTGSKPKFYQFDLKLKKIAALCYATDEQLEDTPNLQSWLTRTVPNVLRFQVEDAIIEGDGLGKPLGIVNSPALISVLREDANEVNPSDIARMWSRRWVGVSDYVWLINPEVSEFLNTFSITTPVYMPPGGMSAAPYGTLYGRPVIETEYAAAYKSAGDILLVSLSQYQAISKGGIQSASSIHVAFTTDETAFRFVYRIDGQPSWHSALTPLHGSTVSPFLSLSAASS